MEQSSIFQLQETGDNDLWRLLLYNNHSKKGLFVWKKKLTTTSANINVNYFLGSILLHFTFLMNICIFSMLQVLNILGKPRCENIFLWLSSYRKIHFKVKKEVFWWHPCNKEQGALHTAVLLIHHVLLCVWLLTTWRH